MAASLLELLSRQSPHFQTRQALLILGLQNDFISSDGVFPVTNGLQFLDRIKRLLPAFRAHGDVYWIRVENNAQTKDFQGSELDDHDTQSGPRESLEASLAATDCLSTLDKASAIGAAAPPTGCCNPGSYGSLFIQDYCSLWSPKDPVITKNRVSSFNDTTLLGTLRSKLCTEVYIVGCMTELCVFSTAVDAASHGLQINIVEDCLGYRSLDRHTDALNRMTEDMGASITTSATMISRFEESAYAPELKSPHAYSPLKQCPSSETDGQQDLVEPAALSAAPALSQDSQDNVSLAHQSHSPEISSTPVVPNYSDRIDWPFVDNTEEQLGWTFVTDPYLSTADAVSIVGDDAPSRRSSFDDEHLLSALAGARLATPPTKETSPDRSSDASEIRTSKKRRSTDVDDLQDQASHDDGASNMLEAAVKRKKCTPSLSNCISKAPGDRIGSGDSYIEYDLLPDQLADSIFDRLLSETHWQTMSHVDGDVPRLVCCQGSVSPHDGAMPVYRHPSDSTLPLHHWGNHVRQVRRLAEQAVGHPLNHALIQLYRGGKDYISEHSDKTLDIVPGSKIVNVSFGAQRTMRLRSKRAQPEVNGSRDQDPARASFTRVTERIHLPHNSIFVLGQRTNNAFLHGIQPNRRLPHDLGNAEQAYGGMRISLTFRQIGTYLSSDESEIWGVGATGKTTAEAKATISGNSDQSQQMINAFGAENQASTFDREAVYRQGYDVLHLKSHTIPSSHGQLFLSGDLLQDEAVTLYLQHLRLDHRSIAAPDLRLKEGSFHDAHGTPISRPSVRRQIMFRDADTLHTQVSGVGAILLYLDRWYGSTKNPEKNRAQHAREVELLTSETYRSTVYLASRALGGEAPVDHGVDADVLTELESCLRDIKSQMMDEQACYRPESKDVNASADSDSADFFLAGPVFDMADCAFYPLVTRLLDSTRAEEREGYVLLREWRRRVDAL